jgi:hypothetical protein
MGILIALPQSEHYTFKRHLSLPTYPLDTINPALAGDAVNLLESFALTGKQDQDSMQVDGETTPERDREQTVADNPLPLVHQEHHLREKEALRRHMITHSLKGTKMSVTRTPFVGEITTVISPTTPEVQFGIKRVGNREVQSHRNMNSAIRYTQTEGSDTFTTEKDYPVGSLRVDTVALCLESWNLADLSGNPIRIDKEAILSYLEPEELDFLYDKALEVNPVLSGAAPRKNDSSGS